MRSTPPKDESGRGAPQRAAAPVAHLPTLLRGVRESASSVQAHFTTSRRRGYDLRDGLAELLSELLGAVGATLERDGPEAALALLEHLADLPGEIAEAVTDCEGQRPLSAVEVAEGLDQAGIPANRRGIGDAAGSFNGKPCSLLFEADGTWIGRERDIEDVAAALAAEPPAIVALVSYSSRGYALALRPRKLSEKMADRPLVSDPAGR